MSHKIIITNEKTTIECIYEGSVTVDEWMDAFEDRICHGGGATFKNARFLVNDYTSADMRSISTLEVLRAVDLANKASEINPDIIIIGIMPGDPEYGLSRMWQFYADHLPWKSFVVRTREECNTIIRTPLSNDQS
jgi:hypothetical protein